MWVPAEDLAEFNQRIVGKIEVVASYYGEKWQGELDDTTGLPKSLPASADASGTPPGS